MPKETNTIILYAYRGNDPTALTPLQEIMLPYLPVFEALLWSVWVGTLFFVITKHIIMPLFSRKARAVKEK
jgi:hypothetical protein